MLSVTRLQKLVVAFVLLAGGLFAGLQFATSAEPRDFSYEDVERLIFRKGTGTFSTRPMVEWVLYVRVTPEEPGGQFDADKVLQSLLEEIRVITGLEFEERDSLGGHRAGVGLYYPEYRTAEEFQIWLEAEEQFFSQVVSSGNVDTLKPFLPAIEAMIEMLRNAEPGIDRPIDEDPSAKVTELFEMHRACSISSRYHFAGNNRAASSYANLGQGSNDFESVGCLIKPFLFVSGLKGAGDFDTHRLLSEQNGAYRASALARCALSIVYAQIMDHRGNGANTAVSRVRAAFETEEGCQ